MPGPETRRIENSLCAGVAEGAASGQVYRAMGVDEWGSEPVSELWFGRLVLLKSIDDSAIVSPILLDHAKQEGARLV